MHKLKTGKGALKDYNRYLADEYDDYAEEPEESDPISHIAHSNTYQQQQVLPNKPKTHKLTIKQTSRWPKYQPDFNFMVASRGIFEDLVGERVAQYLNLSDVAKVLRTCQYLYKIFSRTSIWLYYLTKSYRNLGIPNSALSSINIKQYMKYLRGARSYDIFFEPNEKLGMRNDGIMFDTVVAQRYMKNEEEKQLARNVVDSVTVKSQKTIDTTYKLGLKGTLTGDIKLSWIKEMNQVCVWMAGHHARDRHLQTFAGILFNKKYDEEIGLIKKTCFLNDQYFVVEREEKSEDGLFIKTFEVFVIEPEPNWFEKKEAALCKRVLKESFGEKTENITLKMIGGSLVFIFEREKNMIGVQVFDINRNGESIYKSEDLSLDAGLSDVIPSNSVDKNSFSLYLLDKESSVYVLNYSLESGVTIKKMNQPEKAKEEERLQLFHDKESTLEDQRFSEPIKKYHHGTYKKEGLTVEYLFLFKEKKFYLTKFDTNELIQYDLPEYDSIEPRLYNWAVYENYLYLLLDTTILIYQLDFINHSGLLYKTETLGKSKFNGNEARWILVNPCMMIIVSASSHSEGFARSLQLLIGSTQRLLMKVDPILTSKSKSKREKIMAFDNTWYYDECRIDNIVGHVDKWLTTGKERIEFKFEDERLLIRADVRSYFRDFNVYERRVNQEQYGWRVDAVYNLNVSTKTPTESDVQEDGIKKNDTSYVGKLLAFENNSKMKRIQNWKNVEKKADTDEKVEKKESKKKGEKYFKNVRQGQHREKMSE